MFGDDWGAPAASEVSATTPDTQSAPRVDGDGRALYLRWRPKRFADVVGQEHVTRTLRNAVVRDRVAHAYLFTGPRGTGKTSIARILYRALNCQRSADGDPCGACPLCVAAIEGRALDLVEIDAASNRGIDDIRDLRDRVNYRPSEGRYRVYIVDEAHELTPPAWDAFLKTLEEPPPHAIFVLATTEAHKVPATIVSRCQRFDFRRIPFELIRDQLVQVAEQEGLSVEAAVLERIARSARGGLRDGLSLLDQLSAFAGGQVDMAVARAVLGLPAVEAVRAVVEALGRRDTAALMDRLAEIGEGGGDLRQFVEELTGYLRALLLVCAGADNSLSAEFPADEVSWIRERAGSWTVGALIDLVQGLASATARIRDSQQFQVQVELVLLGTCQEPLQALAPQTAEGRASLSHVAEPPRAAYRLAPPPTGAPNTAPALTQEPRRPKVEVPQEEATNGHEAEAAAGMTLSAEAELAPGATPDGSNSVIVMPAENGAQPVEQSGGLIELCERWPDIVERVTSKKPLVGAVLSTAQPVRIEDGVLVVALRTTFDRKRADTAANRAVIEEAVRHATGAGLKVRCAVTGRGESDAGASLFDDPVLSFAAKTFGGEPRRLS